MKRLRLIEMISMNEQARLAIGEESKDPAMSRLWDGRSTFEQLLDPNFRRTHNIFFDEGDSVYDVYYYVEAYEPETKEWIFEGQLHSSVVAV